MEQQRTLPLSVKGNQTGSWLLAPKLLDGDYHHSIDEWLGNHRPKTVYCLVQFKNVALTEMPRIYLARPSEIAGGMHAARDGKGLGALRDPVPEEWRLTPERLKSVWSSVDKDAPKASLS